MMSQQINFKHTPSGLVHYSLVQKESESGLSYNQRLLIVLSQQYIGYISKPNTKNLADSIDLDKLKSVWPFNQISSIKATGSLLIIKNHKNQKWQFKTKNQVMCQAWEDLLQKQMHIAPSRSATRHNKDGPYRQPSSVFDIPNTNIQRSQTVNERNHFSFTESPIKKQNKSKEQNNSILKSGQKFQRQVELQKAIYSSESLHQNKNLNYINQSQKSNKNVIKNQFQGEKTNQIKLIENFTISKTDSEYFVSQNGRKSGNDSVIQSQIQNGNGLFALTKAEQSFDQQRQNSKLINKNGSQIFDIITPQLPEYIKQQGAYQMEKLQQIEQQIPRTLFVNYFRQHPHSIDDNRYTLFVEYAKRQFLKLLKGQMKIDNLQIDSPRKIPKKSNIKSDYNFSRKIMKNKQQVSQDKPNPLRIQLPDITMIIPLTQLKQVPSQQVKYASHNICHESWLKQSLQELKNYDYIWQCLMRDQTSFRQKFLLPMCCVVQYAGWIGIIKSNYSVSDYEKSLNKNIQYKNVDSSQFFDKLSEITHISRVVFEDPTAIQVIQVPGNKFFIANVASYLPRLGDSSLCLRSQAFLELYKNQKTELYPHHCSLKQKQSYYNIFRINISQKLQKVIKKLQTFQSYFMHPLEISAFFHNLGINIKQIGYVCKSVTNALIKSYLKSEIASRVIKIIFRKKMQQQLQKLTNLGDLVRGNGVGKILCDRRVATIFLNLIFGSGQDHDMLWKIITLHSQVIFGEAVNTKQLHKGYFLLGVQHQIGITIKSKYGLAHIFSKRDYIQTVQFEFKVRKLKQEYLPLSIQVKQTQKVVNLWDIIQQNQMPFEKYAENICKLMNFTSVKIGKLKPNDKASKQSSKDKFPAYFTHNQKELIQNYLAYFISPKNKSDQLQLYSNASPLTIHYCRRQLLKTKWLIKTQQQSQTQSIGDDLFEQEQLFRSLQQLYRKLQKIHKTSPQVQAYPFVSEVRQLLSAYFISKKKYHHAIHQSKLSLTNLLQVCGSNMHVKIANSYYQLSQCYISALNSNFQEQKIENVRNSTFQLLSDPSFRPFNAFQEASNCLKKSKNILQANLLTKTEQYSLIQAQLGKTHLMLYKDQQSCRLLRNAIRIMRQNGSFDISDMIDCYQLLMRSVYSDFNSYVQVSRELMFWIENQMNKDRVQEDDLLRAQQFNQLLSDDLLEKVIKMIIEGQVIALMTISYSNKSYTSLNDYLIELSIAEQIIPRTFALKYIRDLLSYGNFAQFTKLYLQQFETFLQRVQKSRLSIEKEQDIKQFQNYVKNINGLLGDGIIGQMMSNYTHLIKK